MHVLLIGADFEENLGVGVIAAAAERAGHQVTISRFNDANDVEAIALRASREQPDVVGLSMQFQHRAHEFLSLSRRLRRQGFRGHITCGGQFPSLAHREVLVGHWGVDSVVLFDGEETFPALLEAVAANRPLHEVAGLVLLSDDGAVMKTPPRPLVQDLDSVPFPRRYRPHTRHFGVPFIPLMGGRGCWGKCTYCSITTFYRDAREAGGGKVLRHRSPQNVADEMALLWQGAGGAGIFCFHDDNFLMPRPDHSMARVRAIRAALDGYGVGKIGIVGKCRPDSINADLARALKDFGVIRLYVGVENGSAEGADHLGRGTQHEAVSEALSACRQAGIFTCYNLLVFEPDATLVTLRQNIAFIRQHAVHPVNFCRAEPYYGTPLMRDIEGRGGLGGSYLGFDYRIDDSQTELLFRIAAAAFRERNFACDGVANRYMGLGYATTILRHFHEGDTGRLRALERRAEALTETISLDTADCLEAAIELVERHGDNHDRIERETALLGLRVAAADAIFHRQMDALYADFDAFRRTNERPRETPKPTETLIKLAQGVALTASLAAWTPGCDCGDGPVVADPVPVDAGTDAGDMVVDPAPMDAGVDGNMVVDPAPVDGGMDGDIVVDPAPVDAGMDGEVVVDPAPVDAGRDAGVIPVDPAPYDAGVSLRDLHRDRQIDQWRDSSPRRSVRSAELPLFDPPDVRLVVAEAASKGSGKTPAPLEVRVEGGPDSMTVRWEAEGVVEGEGPNVRWLPQHEDAHLRVAVRSKGGIAILSARVPTTRTRG